MTNQSDEIERFTARFIGGPRPGVRITDSTKFSWPLPASIPLISEGGTYRKVAESNLEPQPGNVNHVVRGATYEWRPES